MNILTPITCFSRLLTVLGILHGIRKTMLRRDSRFERRSGGCHFIWAGLSMLAGLLLYAYSRQHGRINLHHRCGVRQTAKRLYAAAGGNDPKQPRHDRGNPGI